MPPITDQAESICAEQSAAIAAMRLEADLAAWAADAEAERAALLAASRETLRSYGLTAEQVRVRAAALREKSIPFG